MYSINYYLYDFGLDQGLGVLGFWGFGVLGIQIF